jgi:hypothetical protein
MNEMYKRTNDLPSHASRQKPRRPRDPRRKACFEASSGPLNYFSDTPERTLDAEALTFDNADEKGNGGPAGFGGGCGSCRPGTAMGWKRWAYHRLREGFGVSERCSWASADAAPAAPACWGR